MLFLLVSAHVYSFSKKNRRRKTFFLCRAAFVDDVSLLIPHPVETVPGAIGSQSRMLSGSPTTFGRKYAD
jgi:hypothetical protein